MAVLEPLGPSTELAWAYASLAGQRMFDGQDDAAIVWSRRAQALAESLGVPEVLSDALNTEGCAAANQGADWPTPMRRALEIAVAEGLQAQAGRTYANLHAILCGQRRFGEAERCFADGIAYCDEHDIGTYGTCLRGERAAALEKLGRWEESASLSEELLTGSGASPVNRINPLISLGKVRARQGAPGCWECLDEAAAAAEGSGVPQFLVLVRLARAEAYWLEGRPDSAVVKPGWLMTSAPGAMHGTGGRSLPGCGAPARPGRRAVTSPSPAGCRRQATGSRPPGCGPAWAARTRPRWPCTTRPRTRRCARP